MQWGEKNFSILILRTGIAMIRFKRVTRPINILVPEPNISKPPKVNITVPSCSLRRNFTLINFSLGPEFFWHPESTWTIAVVAPYVAFLTKLATIFILGMKSLTRKMGVVLRNSCWNLLTLVTSPSG